MSRNRKRKDKLKEKQLENQSIIEWRKFMTDKFDNVRTSKAMLLYTWYLGDSDLLTEAYLNADYTTYAQNHSGVRNGKTYFWSIASTEADVKKTHSGIPKAIIKTLINILNYPTAKVMTEEAKDGQLETLESDADTNRLLKILEDNDFESIVKQQQEPMTWAMGDGVYLVNVDEEISDMPLIEYVDARNCAFEIVSNRVTKVYTRKYFFEGVKGYMLLQERGTTMFEGARTAYQKYNLFELNNNKDRSISKEVSLLTLEETKGLKAMSVIKGIDELLAVPCIYDYEPVSERGTSLFNEKMDLFDDLDQCLSQDANCIRLSTPVEFIDEAMIESDTDGKPIVPNRYDRRYVTVKKGVNSVGENGAGITSTVPQIDFGKYSNEALSLTSQILTGIISPCTIGADVSKKDNADAQREKEKQTFFTRDNLISMQTTIFKKLYNLVLKTDDIMNGKKPQEYEIVIDYEEYGNPTFDAKLQSLYPAFVAGAMSPKRYVDELYGESMNDEEKEKEIEYLLKSRTTGYTPDDPLAYDLE